MGNISPPCIVCGSTTVDDRLFDVAVSVLANFMLLMVMMSLTTWLFGDARPPRHGIAIAQADDGVDAETEDEDKDGDDADDDYDIYGYVDAGTVAPLPPPIPDAAGPSPESEPVPRAGGGAGQCVVCMDQPSTQMFSKCRHVCMCDWCTPRYLASEAGAYNKCPVCARCSAAVKRVFIT